MKTRVGCVLVAAAVGLPFGAAFADYDRRGDVTAYIERLASDHGFEPGELRKLFARVERKQSVLDAIARPAERTLKWHEYRDIFVTDSRIEQGVEFWRLHARALNRAYAEFGVPPEMVVAILGVETRYGAQAGTYRVMDALTTLGFDYPPRSGFFRRELTQFLLLAREEGRDPLSLTGSYAGAMGYGQFIPSSFRSYAIDFDGDGLRDIWTNPDDAIGSVANYFARHGWQADRAVAVPVRVDGDRHETVVNQGLDLKWTVAQLADLGVTVPDVPGETPAALFRFEGEDGSEYWVGFEDFYVITRYNRSRLYALAVYQLSQAIREGAA